LGNGELYTRHTFTSPAVVGDAHDADCWLGEPEAAQSAKSREERKAETRDNVAAAAALGAAAAAALTRNRRDPACNKPRRPLPIPPLLAAQIRNTALECRGWSTHEFDTALISRFALYRDWWRGLGYPSPGTVFALFVSVQGQVERRRRRGRAGSCTMVLSGRPIDVPLACAEAQAAHAYWSDVTSVDEVFASTYAHVAGSMDLHDSTSTTNC